MIKKEQKAIVVETVFAFIALGIIGIIIWYISYHFQLWLWSLLFCIIGIGGFTIISVMMLSQFFLKSYLQLKPTINQDLVFPLIYSFFQMILLVYLSFSLI